MELGYPRAKKKKAKMKNLYFSSFYIFVTRIEVMGIEGILKK